MLSLRNGIWAVIYELGWLFIYFQRELRCWCWQVKPNKILMSLPVMLLELLVDCRGNSKWSLTAYKREELSSQREVLNFFLVLGPISWVPSLVRGCHITLTLQLQMTGKGVEKLKLGSLSQWLSATVLRVGLRFLGLSWSTCPWKNLKSKNKQKTGWSLRSIKEELYSPLHLRCRQQLTLSFPPLAHKGSWVITYD